MMVAAFVGTTMAAATFLSRPLFIQGKGWGMENQSTQRYVRFSIDFQSSAFVVNLYL